MSLAERRNMMEDRFLKCLPEVRTIERNRRNRPTAQSVPGFLARWDVAVTGKVPDALNDRLGIAIAKRTYKAYLGLLSSPRWMRAYNAGARPQRLLWASTGTKDPKASDVLYVQALAAPFTVNTIPAA